MGFLGPASKGGGIPNPNQRNLTKEELKKIFMACDINNDKHLSREELKKAFANLGALIPRYRAARAISNADANNDGEINMNELDDLLNYAFELGYKSSNLL